MNIAWHAPNISALDAASCMMIQGLDASRQQSQKNEGANRKVNLPNGLLKQAGEVTSPPGSEAHREP